MPAQSGLRSLPTIIERLNRAYPNARYELTWETPVQLLVATILAAQNTDERINQVTPALFARYPDAQAFATADPGELEQALRNVNFYRNKARAIQNACKALVDNFGGEVPQDMDQLITLPGVARKTANVVLNNAFRIPSGIIVDTHVARVSQRLGLSKQTKPEKIELDLMKAVPQDEWVQFGPAMVLFGRYVCTASAPKCPECVMNDVCPKIGVTETSAGDGESSSQAAQPTPAKSSKTAPKAPPAKKEETPAKAAPAKSAAPAETAAANLGEQLPESWRPVLAGEFQKPYFRKLQQFVSQERREHTVFPPEEDVFNAFKFTPYDQVKVLLLGQDPYHDDGQAHGLCFSVKPGVKVPPSLVNIFKELHDDLGCPIPDHGTLTPWAKQGVMLLNAVLTVRAHKPASHKEQGWEEFTDAVIRALNARPEPVVFLLWGAYAQAKQQFIDTNRHRVITAAHPSPLSAKKFFGSRPFSKTNEALKGLGQDPIDWRLPNLADGPLEVHASDAGTSSPAKAAPARPATTPAKVSPPAEKKPAAQSTPAVATQPAPSPAAQLQTRSALARHLPLAWLAALRAEFDRPYFQRLEKFLAEERQSGPVLPAEEEVFAAFQLTLPPEVKVVLVGEEPAAEPGLATGLAFSSRPGQPPSPALLNLFQELRRDLGCRIPATGDLTPWAREGVLLLNTVLTVREGEPGSHEGKGWENFTDAVLRLLNERPEPSAFLLCGAAQRKEHLIDAEKHFVLTSEDPSSADFAGSRPFSAINNALERRGRSAVYWQLFPF